MGKLLLLLLLGFPLSWSLTTLGFYFYSMKTYPIAHYLGAVFGILPDFVLSLYLSMVLLDFPQEWTTTRKLKRLQFNIDWRGDLTRWIITNFVNPIDPTHIS